MVYNAAGLCNANQKRPTGELAQARGLYEQILARDSEHADALHFLGVIAHETGQQTAAAELIRKAIAHLLRCATRNVIPGTWKRPTVVCGERGVRNPKQVASCKMQVASN